MKRSIVIALIVASAGVALADEVAVPAASRPAPPQGAGAPMPMQRQQPDPRLRRAPHRPPMPPPPPAVVTPDPELVRLGKQLAGTYRCKGVSLRGDGSSSPLQGKLAIKLDVGGAWIHGSFNAKGGPALEDFRSLDPVSKQWTRVQLASTSGHTIETSLGERNGMWTWTGNQTAPSGTLAVRDFEKRDGKDLKLWGEAMLSGSWQKLYEVTCRR